MLARKYRGCTCDAGLSRSFNGDTLTRLKTKRKKTKKSHYLAHMGIYVNRLRRSSLEDGISLSVTRRLRGFTSSRYARYSSSEYYELQGVCIESSLPFRSTSVSSRFVVHATNLESEPRYSATSALLKPAQRFHSRRAKRKLFFKRASCTLGMLRNTVA